MKTTFIAICLLFSFASKADDWGIFNSKPVARFKVSTTTPYKEVYSEALQYYLLKEGKNSDNNHFCMVGYDWQDGRRSAVLFWREGNDIFDHWVLGQHPDENDYMSLTYSHIVDQKTAVFTPEKRREFYTEDEIHDDPDIIPMYGFSQNDVDRQRRDCDEYGEIIVISAFSPPQNCRNTDIPETIHLCEAIDK